MRRFFVPPEAVQGDRVVLPPEESRHATAVLRLRPGERIIVFDGRGQDYLVELTAVTPRAVEGRVIETHAGARPAVHLTLVQGVPKGAKMDTIIRMGTELGIARFVPVLTHRAVARPAPARGARWRRIAAAAATQSGRSTVPVVDDPRSFSEVWPLLEDALVLIPWEGEKSRPIGAILAQDRGARAVAVCIGPEGGWTPEEVQQAVAHGAHPVTLGDLILRTETAGLVAAAMVLYELTRRP